MTVTDHTSPPTFEHLAGERSRLIRCTDPPDLETLAAGDMVICEETWDALDFADAAAAKGVHVRMGRYRHEVEKVIARRTRRMLNADFPKVLDLGHVTPPGAFADEAVVDASAEAFARTWDALTAPPPQATYQQAADLVPAQWLEYLPYPTLNPAQVQALPAITGGGAVTVVAPTGAGKTVIGMLAGLKELKERGGKVAWLVPQRSLTAELDRDLQLWRDQGLKVVALSGEAATDTRLTKEADVLVATTEKFEALCRATSMRDVVASIGTLVVDEIHLLGEPSRGPLLETLLARIRGHESGVRLVGLSATAANAEEVSDWLGSELVEITWRPTRQTHQLLTIPAGDRQQQGRHRNALCAAITEDVTRDGGSTLVFCGTKANVRSTALSIASSRGADTHGVDQADIDAVAEACASVGVGLHYSDWPHKRQAEKDFRDRTTNVLVATSTLAAGVNTPARVVVVRDTSIGPQPMEVSMIQQMFGRAGRAGQEAEGWSYLVCAADEVGRWRSRLSAGYTIRSGLLDGVADHLLGEIVQQRISTLRGMRQWWVSTLAHHQGTQDTGPLDRAKDFLESWRFIECEETSQGQMITATPLGSVTSKMMVPVRDAANLSAYLARAALPRHHLAAEDTIITGLAEEVVSLAGTPDPPPDQAAQVARVLAAGGDVRSLDQGTSPSRRRTSGADVVRAGLLLCARSPRAVASRGRQVAGINSSLLLPALLDTPRYLAWLAALGPLGLAPAWASVVAADLGARVTHHRLAPPRGSGRLLRLCEQVTRSTDTPRITGLWNRVCDARASDPHDWPFPDRPEGAAVNSEQYRTVLAARADLHVTNSQIRTPPGVTVYGPATRGTAWKRLSSKSTHHDGSGPLAAFSARGDWVGTDWLAPFSRISTSSS